MPSSGSCDFWLHHQMNKYRDFHIRLVIQVLFTSVIPVTIGGVPSVPVVLF